jgi:glutathione S-transferase
MTPLLFKLVFDKIRTAAPLIVRPIAGAIANQVEKGFYGPNIRRHLDFMEAELKDRDWFAGPEFSAADVQMSFPLEASAARGGLDARYPRLQDWLARIHARPAYQRALERGGPYRILG